MRAVSIGSPLLWLGRDATALATPTFHEQTLFDVGRAFVSFALCFGVASFLPRLPLLLSIRASFARVLFPIRVAVPSLSPRKRSQLSVSFLHHLRTRSFFLHLHRSSVLPFVGRTTPSSNGTSSPSVVGYSPSALPPRAVRSPVSRADSQATERAPPSRITPRPRERSVTTKVLVKS